MPIFQNARYVRWFLAHADELRPLLELPGQLRNAVTLPDKWAVIRDAADRIVSVLDDFPEVSMASEPSDDEVSVLQHRVEMQGLPWDQVTQLLPILMQIIRLIREGESL